MEMDEPCIIEGCKNPAASSSGLCHEHETEARMQEAEIEGE